MADFKRIIAVLVLIGIVGGLGYVYYFYMPPLEEPAPGVTEAPVTTTAAPPKTTAPPRTVPATSNTISEDEQFLRDLTQEKTSACYICHERENTKALHTLPNIVKIDERKELRRKTCVDCHGPRGPPWSATEQMVDPEDMVFDNASGEYKIAVEVPHVVHKERLLNGQMTCYDCHTPDLGTFDMVVPITDFDRGQMMYCQNCKIPQDPHPEDGNYVTTHVDRFGQKCGICHPGGVEQIHRLG